MAIVILSIILVGIFFALMSVRLFLVKGGEFRGTCASQSPWLTKEGVTCGYCGKTLTATDQQCGDQNAKKAPLPEVRKSGK